MIYLFSFLTSIVKPLSSELIPYLAHTLKKISISVVYFGLIYGLAACGGSNNEEPPIAIIADITAPSTPSNLIASAAIATQVNLNWTASTDNIGVAKYQIFRGGNAAAFAETTTTNYTDASVIANTNYSYTVKAVDAANNISPASNTATVTTPVASTTPTAFVIAPLGSPRILISDAATMSRLRNLLSSSAPSALRFKTMVDSQIAGTNHYGFEPWYAALMGQITGTASYCSYAVSRTENFVASEEALVASNARPTVAGDSYLEVGPQIGNVALVYDWCRSSMTDAQRTRWRNYANQAVWNVWNHPQARWGTTLYPWSGWSVDNPVNNYYYSFLEATGYLGLATYGEDAQAANWINQFRTAKLENQLFPAFNRDLSGGGSREGTGYGTALKNLWQLYDWWERSTGQRVAEKTPHTLASIPHMMHSIVPTLDRLTPTGDHARDETAALFDYHRAYLQELIRLFPNERLSGVAKTLLAQSSVPQMAHYFMYYNDFLYDTTDVTAHPLTDLSTAYWGVGTGQFSMRTDWSRTAAYANFICGPYTESHAHADQGSFTLFKGTWLAYDANMDGHSGILQEVNKHNLVRFENNGTDIRQTNSDISGAGPCQMSALANTSLYAYASAKITAAYRTPTPVVKSEREFLFIKPATFVVFDRAQTSGTGMRRIWTINLPSAPTVSGTAGSNISLALGANRLDVTRLAPINASVQVGQWATYEPSESFRPNATRVDVIDTTAGDSSVFLHVLSTDGAVTQSIRSDSTGQVGTIITLADGRVVTVRFNTSSTGGTIEIRSSSGTILESGALPSGIQSLPLFVN